MTSEKTKMINFVERNLEITKKQASDHLKSTLLNDDFFNGSGNAMERAGFVLVASKTVGHDFGANIELWENLSSKTESEKFCIYLDFGVGVDEYFTCNAFTALKFLGDFCKNAETVFSMQDGFDL